MTYLLDTNACIDHLRYGPTSRVAARLLTVSPGDVVLCSVVLAELEYGARRSSGVSHALAQIRSFRSAFDSLSFDDQAGSIYALVKADLFARGTPIGPNDLLIAASHSLTD